MFCFLQNALKVHSRTKKLEIKRKFSQKSHSIEKESCYCSCIYQLQPYRNFTSPFFSLAKKIISCSLSMKQKHYKLKTFFIEKSLLEINVTSDFILRFVSKVCLIAIYYVMSCVLSMYQCVNILCQKDFCLSDLLRALQIC